MSEEEPAPIKSLETLILPAPPSCILNTDYGYIVGTYTLHGSEAVDERDAELGNPAPEQTEFRSGSLLIIRPQGPDGQSDFKVIASFETESAVFDIAENYFDRRLRQIAVANSTGGIELWSPTHSPDDDPADDSAPNLVRTKLIQAFSRNIMVLKLCAAQDKSDPDTFAVSLSDGTIAVVDACEDHACAVWSRRVHELEPWEIVWFPVPAEQGDAVREQLLSGGDDSAVRISIWNIEADGDAPLTDVAVAADTRTHGAGVTALVSLWYALGEMGPRSGDLRNMVISGSYDDHIRLLHVGRGTRWRCLAETNLGGGVWRIQPLTWAMERGRELDIDDTPSADGPISVYLLVSCMYAGTRIVRLQRDEAGTWRFTVVAKFTEHESMNYASVSCFEPNLIQIGEKSKGDDCLRGQMFVSTSFYDKRFCVWKV